MTDFDAVREFTQRAQSSQIGGLHPARLLVFPSRNASAAAANIPYGHVFCGRYPLVTRRGINSQPRPAAAAIRWATDVGPSAMGDRSGAAVPSAPLSRLAA
jgi:hypothetical protein